MTFKQEIIIYYKTMLQDRIDVLQDRIKELATDAQNYAKSSAGDKHETSLSMMQLEQEKTSAKLRQELKLQTQFKVINFFCDSSTIALGSLVKANSFYFLIAVTLPKIKINNQTIFAISPDAPLGSLLLGKKKGETVVINNMAYQIEEVC